jgi:hypothetical protein
MNKSYLTLKTYAYIFCIVCDLLLRLRGCHATDLYVIYHSFLLQRGAECKCVRYRYGLHTLVYSKRWAVVAVLRSHEDAMLMYIYGQLNSSGISGNIANL